MKQLHHYHVLIKKMVETFGDKLESLYTYGEEASPSIVAIFQAITPPLLLQQKQILSSFKQSYPEIHYFTVDELLHALDVFPVEFLTMAATGKCHHGKDLLSTLDISTENLRHECEFYLRSNVLKLRHACCQPKSNLTLAIQDSFPSFIRLFNLLPKLAPNLSVQTQDTDALIRHLSTQFEIDLSVYLSIYHAPKGTNLDHLFEAYLGCAESLATYLDHASLS